MCDSVHRGGVSASVHAGIHSYQWTPGADTSREQTPPRAETPPGADTPWEQTPPGAETPRADTPLTRKSISIIRRQ